MLTNNQIKKLQKSQRGYAGRKKVKTLIKANLNVPELCEIVKNKLTVLGPFYFQPFKDATAN